MPNPMYLKVMGISIHEYNSYSPAKKARFQKAAHQKLVDVHESDMNAYTKLTQDTAAQVAEDAEDVENSAKEDKEFS